MFMPALNPLEGRGARGLAVRLETVRKVLWDYAQLRVSCECCADVVESLRIGTYSHVAE